MASRVAGTRRNAPKTLFKGNGTQSHTLESLVLENEGKGKFSMEKHLAKFMRGIDLTSTEEIIYVLDTNVIMNAYDAVLNFKEHTVCIPGQVWKELDKFKQERGFTDRSWNARKAIRLIDGLAAGKTADELKSGIQIVSTKEFEVSPLCTGKIIFDFSVPKKPKIDVDLDINHPDDKIIMICIARKLKGERVVLVSNDGNCRVKARLCGIESEEYLSDAAIAVRGEEDLRPGFHVMPSGFWESQDVQLLPKHIKGGEVSYQLTHPCLKNVYINEFLVMEDESLMRVTHKKGKSVTAMYVRPEKGVRDVVPSNKEQVMALHLLMDPTVTAVSLAGLAGSGKTYLALAAAFYQVYDLKRYDRIIVTRPTASTGDDIGFLPGTEEEKMVPWLGAIFDNLEVLAMPDDYSDGKVNEADGYATTLQYLMKKVQVKSLNFIKGRSMQRTLVIVDESQDLTAKLMKTTATRVGEGSKIVFLGNVAQIDDPYLTEHNCGLSVWIRSFRNASIVGHVTLQKGVRSELATLVEERLSSV